MTRMPSLVLLDLMGTLVREPFYRDVPEFFGMSLRELLSIKHPTSWLEFENGAIDEETFLRSFFADGRDFDRAGLVEHMRAAYAYLPGAEALLADLKSAGVRLAILSNYPVWYRMIDERLRYSRFVERGYYSCELGVRKPNPEIYAQVLDDVGLPAEELLFVDDRPENCAGAEKLGMRTLHFTDVPDLRAELTRRELLRADAAGDA